MVIEYNENQKEDALSEMKRASNASAHGQIPPKIQKKQKKTIKKYKQKKTTTMTHKEEQSINTYLKEINEL